jgi:hypothetical protein
MKELYTTTFRNIVRLALARQGIVHTWQTWTDKASIKNKNKRIVTFYVTKNLNEVFSDVKNIMTTVGIDPDTFNLRMTYSGYIKCNCVKPGNILI